MTITFNENTALLNVDLQNDFIPNGALAVNDGDEVVPLVNALRARFQKVIWTKEEHPAGHAFFASSRTGKNPLDTVETSFGTQFLWPDHCIKGTTGAEMHKDLIINKSDMMVIKGTDPSIHAYSAVYMDDRKTIIRYQDGQTLPEKLRAEGITEIYVTGLAYDFCAGLTAYDLAQEGFKIRFIRDASRSIKIPLNDSVTTLDEMDKMLAKAGVEIVYAADVLKQNIGIGVKALTL